MPHCSGSPYDDFRGKIGDSYVIWIVSVLWRTGEGKPALPERYLKRH